jgi:hypothetical protein
MRRLINKKRTIEHSAAIRDVLDTHQWPAKMEIHRLLSGKPDLKIKAVVK